MRRVRSACSQLGMDIHSYTQAVECLIELVIEGEEVRELEVVSYPAKPSMH